MASRNVPSSVVSCAESIALLYLLHSVPTLPSSNSINNLPSQAGGYTLSFARERTLVGTLAFLSNVKDDPNHIPALCVKEKVKSSQLDVLLAVNRGKWEDGTQLLQEVQQGFEKVFQILSKVSKERSQTRALEDEIFAATISMCSSRILCRLRFVPNHRKKKKQPFKTVLQDAIRSLVELGDGNPVDQLSALSLFVSRARETVRLTDSWTKHQTIGQLQDLIQNIYHLKQISGLEALLDKIPNRAMSPSSRRNLVNIISKTARYREAARFLCRTAKQFPVVRNMKVTLVNLPREAFQRVSTNAYTPSLPDRITQIEGVSRKKCLDHMCRVMQVTEIQASEQFASRTKKTMKEAKIHAEIQLLFFCELNPSTLPPRVICSSKDACFLCNAFLRMHGKMHIPRQHGRLYSGWRLPFVPELNDLQQRFNSVLEGHIQQAFSNILSRNKKSLYPDPNESTILTLPVSVSTVPDTSTPKPVAQGRETFPTRISHRSITSEGERLVQGELPLNAISASHTTQLYRGGPIEIYVERAADIVEVVPEDLSREIAYRVAWLSLEESKRLLEHENMSCVDAEAIQGEVLHELDNQGCLFLRFHKDVVKISV